VSKIIAFIPGILAAIAAFVALQIVDLLGFNIIFDFLLFLVTYIVVAIVARNAMKNYASMKI
jgi:membrane protein implicated in regulation of membrane protease activity